MTRSGKRPLAARLMVAGLVVIAGLYGLSRLLTSGLPHAIGVDYHAGKIEAHNSSSVGASTSTSGDSAFAPRRIAILLDNEHPALDLGLEKLREELLALDYIHTVDVYHSGESPAPGDRLYDAYIRLTIEVQRDDKLLLDRDFSAKVTFAAAAMPYISRSGYRDDLTPPEVIYELNGKLDHVSNSTQVGTPYHLIAENIADAVADSLASHFDKWQAKYGIDFDWPEALIPAYDASREIPWPDSVEMDLVVDGNGLLRPRRAMWSKQTDDPHALVRALHDACQDSGWQIESGEVLKDNEHHERLYFRAWDGMTHEIEVFEPREENEGLGPGEPSLICLRYEQRVDLARVRAIIDQLFDEPGQLSVLRYFKRSMTGEQQERYHAALADTQPTDPGNLIELAYFAHRQERVNDARDYLMRAVLSAHRSPDPSDTRKAIRKAAKTMEFEDSLVDPPMTAEFLSGYGYRPLVSRVDEVLAVGLQEPVRFYYESAGEMHAIELWLASDAAGLISLHHYERAWQGSTSWGSGGGHVRREPLHVKWSIRADSGRYVIHFEQEPDGSDSYEVSVVPETVSGSDAL